MKGLLPVVLDTRRFSSAEEIYEFEKANFRIKVKPQEVYIDFKKINTDVFQIRGISFDWIITDRLARKLLQNKITGCTIREIDWLKVL